MAENDTKERLQSYTDEQLKKELESRGFEVWKWDSWEW